MDRDQAQTTIVMVGIAIVLLGLFGLAGVIDEYSKDRAQSSAMVIECIKSGRSPTLDNAGWFRACDVVPMFRIVPPPLESR